MFKKILLRQNKEEEGEEGEEGEEEEEEEKEEEEEEKEISMQRRNRLCLLYTSPSPRDRQKSRMPSSA